MVRKLIDTVRLQIVLYSLLIAGFAYGNTATPDTAAIPNNNLHEQTEEKAFDAGKMIIDHIVDAH